MPQPFMWYQKIASVYALSNIHTQTQTVMDATQATWGLVSYLRLLLSTIQENPESEPPTF